MPFILALVLSVLVSLGIVKIVIIDVDYFHIIFGFNVFSIPPNPSALWKVLRLGLTWKINFPSCQFFLWSGIFTFLCNIFPFLPFYVIFLLYLPYLWSHRVIFPSHLVFYYLIFLYLKRFCPLASYWGYKFFF